MPALSELGEYLDRYMDGKHVFCTIDKNIVVAKLMEKSTVKERDIIIDSKYCRYECDKVMIIDMIEIEQKVMNTRYYCKKSKYKIGDIYEPGYYFYIFRHYGPVVNGHTECPPMEDDNGRKIFWDYSGAMNCRTDTKFYEVWDENGKLKVTFHRANLIYNGEYKVYNDGYLLYVIWFDNNVINWKKTIKSNLLSNAIVKNLIILGSTCFIYSLW